MSAQTRHLISLSEEFFDSFVKAPMGIVKFSALMRRAASKVKLDEGKRDEVILLLTRGITDPRAYARILSSFLGIMENTLTQNEAAADCVRCLFGKALSSIITENVPKYKNEAARRKFFDDLVTLSEIIHPLPMDKVVAKLARFETEKMWLHDRLIAELDSMISGGWHCENEVEVRLEQADKVLASSLAGMEQLCGFSRGEIGKYREDLRVSSFFDPWLVDDQKTTFWGTRYYPVLNCLNIQPPYLFFDELTKCLIARDVAHLFNPRVMEKMDRSYEQTDYCAYKILEKPFEREFWKVARHGLREDSKAFEGIEYYEEWDQITGGDFIRRIFSRLESIGQFKSQIDLSEYEAIADSLALKPKRVKLDSGELKILDLMSKDPLVSISRIAQKTGLTLPTVQRTVRELERKANVWPFLVVDTNQFGISAFLLMLKTKTGLASDVAEEIWKIPYCGRVYRVYGGMNLLAYINVPFGNETFIHEFASQLKRAEIVDDFLWYGIKDFYYGFNPRYYSPEMGEWNVYWDEWGLWLKEYLSTKAWHRALRSEDECPKLQVKINRLDLQIMSILRMNARHAFSDIGHKIGVSGAYVGQRVRRLLDHNVIQPKIASFRIGLDDAVWVVLDCDDDTTRALVSAFNELPMWQGFSVKGDVSGLAAIMYVPTGETQELLRVFDRYLIDPRLINDYSFHVIEKWTGMRRWLPVDLYQNEKGWLFESHRYIEELKTNIASIKS